MLLLSPPHCTHRPRGRPYWSDEALGPEEAADGTHQGDEQGDPRKGGSELSLVHDVGHVPADLVIDRGELATGLGCELATAALRRNPRHGIWVVGHRDVLAAHHHAAAVGTEGDGVDGD